MQSFRQFFESEQVSTKDFVKLFNQEKNAKINPFNPNISYYQEGDALVMFSMKAYPSDVYVSDLSTEPRGFPAIKFLQTLTNMADKYKITLTCISQPLKVANKVRKDRLTRLYKRFGFKIDKGSKDRMTRLPK